MKFAIIETGGKQYRVAEGDVLRVEKLSAEPGASVTFQPVLLLADGERVAIGQPSVKDAKVLATVSGQGRGKKILVQKFHAKTRYRRLRGHRQPFTSVKIEKIVG